LLQLAFCLDPILQRSATFSSALLIRLSRGKVRKPCAIREANRSSAEILERAQKDGIDFPVLAKPIPPEELFSAVRSLLKA
jgi:hypothetical protein